MVCIKCKSEMGNILITKGSRAIGMNFFCKNSSCNYEVDTSLKRRSEVNSNG